jgi:plastocyanin
MQPDTPPTQVPPKPHVKRWVVILAVIVLVASMLLLLLPKAGAGRVDAQVNISSSGLTPATVQIKAGTVVTWTNDDANAHQVAANPYPKNDSIPKFDSHVVLQHGDTLSFKFETAGKYTYHDERQPFNKAFQGTIVVK